MIRPRYLSFLLLLTVLLGGGGVVAAVKIPPKVTQRIVDQGAILTGPQEQHLDEALQRFEAATGGQMVVFTIPSLEGEPIEDLGIRTAEAWKIGRKDVDNGAILIIAVKDHAMRLEIGYGWEGQVNDARAGDIIRAMGPAFRRGDYEGGIAQAIAGLQGFITGDPTAAANLPPEEPRRSRLRGRSIFSLFMLFWILTLLYSAFRRSRGYTTYGSRGGRRYGGTWGGGFGGGGFGGSSGGGGFSAGGGSFGGGGASGGW